MTPRCLCLIAALPVAALALTGCASSDDTNSDDSLSIVATTNVYADIAETVAGDRASVTSFINSSSQDPHEYEASSRDRLAVEDADIVVENGGGYDHFVDVLLDDAHSDAPVLNAVALSGLASAEEARGDEEIEGLNEHVWYDFEVVDTLAKKLSDELGRLDPEGKSAYQANYQALARQLDELESAATRLKSNAGGQAAAITEPVPLYLLEAIGLVNKTPADFSEAVEEGEDVPPRALQSTLDLFASDQVALLAYNDQTSDATTEQVRTAAEAAGVPVVDFTETLPDGQSYVEWQQSNLDHLAAALD